MKTDSVARFLTGLQDRLNSIAGQSEEAIVRLENTLERIHRLRKELTRLERQLRVQNCSTTVTEDTAEFIPVG
jgi:hypothetical protein